MKSLSIIFVILFAIVAVSGQGTEFSYQGRLNDNSLPATGTYEFVFRLYDTDDEGTLLGTVQRGNVPVTNGLFSVNLDFGAVFTGGERWLAISVRQMAGGQTFTDLTPRQQVVSAPYAVRSLNASLATNSAQLGGQPASQYVITTDPRMTDARNPLAGNGNYIQNTTATQTTSNFNIDGNGNVGGTISANAVTAATQYNIGINRVLKLASSSIHLGPLAGESYVSGSGNSYFGDRAGRFGMSASNNSFFGRNAGELNTASENSFFGAFAGDSNTTGTRNSFFGRTAGDANSTGNDNSFFGYSAGRLSTASSNSFFGSQSGDSATSGANNSFFGYNTGASNTTGEGGSFFGYNAGAVTTVGGNSFFGRSSGESNTTGNGNSFFGYQAGRANDTSIGNSFFGYRAGALTKQGAETFSGGGNSFFGWSAGELNIDGENNTFFGASAGRQTLGGDNNTFVGAGAGDFNTFGNNNTAVGYGADFSLNNLHFATAIGAGAVVDTSNTIVIGRGFLDTVKVGHLVVGGNINMLSVQTARLGTTHIDGAFYAHLTSGTGDTHLCINDHTDGLVLACASSLRYKSNVKTFTDGLDIVRRLRPITFNWIDTGVESLGFAAEEVEQVQPLLATYNKDGVIQGVKYGQITTVLVNAVNEQQSQIEAQNKRIDEQSEQLREQQAQIHRMSTVIDSLKGVICKNRSRNRVCKP